MNEVEQDKPWASYDSNKFPSVTFSLSVLFLITYICQAMLKRQELDSSVAYGVCLVLSLGSLLFVGCSSLLRYAKDKEPNLMKETKAWQFIYLTLLAAIIGFYLRIA